MEPDRESYYLAIIVLGLLGLFGFALGASVARKPLLWAWYLMYLVAVVTAILIRYYVEVIT